MHSRATTANLWVNGTEVRVVSILRDLQVIVTAILFGHITEHVTEFTAANAFKQRLERYGQNLGNLVGDTCGINIKVDIIQTLPEETIRDR